LEQSSTPIVLYGAKAIGEAMGISPKAAQHLLVQGKIPARKIGKTWAISRPKLIAYIDNDDAKASAA
jgi:hypothetical protein